MRNTQQMQNSCLCNEKMECVFAIAKIRVYDVKQSMLLFGLNYYKCTLFQSLTSGHAPTTAHATTRSIGHASSRLLALCVLHSLIHR